MEEVVFGLSFEAEGEVMQMAVSARGIPGRGKHMNHGSEAGKH